MQISKPPSELEAVESGVLIWDDYAVRTKDGGVVLELDQLPIASMQIRQRKFYWQQISAATKEEHFAQSRQADHPYNSPPVLPAGIASALRRIKLEGPNIEAFHKERLLWWMRRVRDCQEEQTRAALAVHPSLHPSAERLQTVALGKRLKELNYKDPEVAEQMCEGLMTIDQMGPWGIWGEAKNASVERGSAAPSSPSTAAQARLPDMCKLLLQSDPADQQAIWNEAIAQEASGWVSALQPLEAMGKDVAPVRRFRIHPEGRKNRSCDDCSDGPGGNEWNTFCHAGDRIRLPSDESVCAVVFAIMILFGPSPECQPFGSKDDLEDAYKQLARSMRSKIAIVLVEPGTNKLYFRLVYTLLFGEEGAVYQFLRVMAALLFILQVDLAVPVDALFDDMWILSPKFAMASCVATLHEWLSLVGFRRKESKYISPRRSLPIGGLCFHFKNSPQQVLICNQQEKIHNYCRIIESILQADLLSHGQAQKLAQKLTFAGRGLFGLSGAAPRRALFRALSEGCAVSPLPPLVRSVLTVWERLLRMGKPREVLLRSVRHPPIIVYADAMLRPSRGLPSCGAIAAAPSGIVEFFLSECPAGVVRQFLVDEDTCIARAEAWIQADSVATWKNTLAQEDAIFFCDNTAVLGSLVRGSSSALDLSNIVGAIWSTIAAINCRIWWEFVPSELNVADPLSRGSVKLALA